MGSLMAGWDSPTRDAKSVKLMRNKSHTKEEIEEYWKLRKKTEEEHLKSISPRGSIAQEFVEKEYKRANSLPMINVKGDHFKAGHESDIDLEDLIKKNGWWTRSNWAFLNEPPVIDSEVPKYKYASQYHVA